MLILLPPRRCCCRTFLASTFASTSLTAAAASALAVASSLLASSGLNGQHRKAAACECNRQHTSCVQQAAREDVLLACILGPKRGAGQRNEAACELSGLPACTLKFEQPMQLRNVAGRKQPRRSMRELAAAGPQTQLAFTLTPPPFVLHKLCTISPRHPFVQPTPAHSRWRWQHVAYPGLGHPPCLYTHPSPSPCTPIVHPLLTSIPMCTPAPHSRWRWQHVAHPGLGPLSLQLAK